MWICILAFFVPLASSFICIFPFFIDAKKSKNLGMVITVYAIPVAAFLFGSAFLMEHIDASARLFVEGFVCALLILSPFIVYFFGFEENANKKVFYTIVGMVIMAIIASIEKLLSETFLALWGIVIPNFAKLLLQFGLSILICIVNIFAFRKNKNAYSSEKPDLGLFLFAIGDAVILAATSFVAALLPENLPAYKIGLYAIVIIMGFILIYGQYLLLLNSSKSKELGRLEMEKELMKRLQNERLKQYDVFKSTVDLINLKYHDLKHRFGGGIIDPRIQEELSSGVEAYDIYCHTNNETLDVILTQLSFEGQSKGISLEVVADGNCLSFLSIGEIYSLFGNAIDNAFSYLSHFPDKQKRFVRVKVKSRMNLCLIAIENYYEGDWEDDSRKEGEHGYGLKSISAIAAKYDGSLSIKKENNLFSLSILLIKPRENSD